MMDTNAMLLPANNARDRVDALIEVVKANTAGWKEVRHDLSSCNNQEKVQAIIYKVEAAMTDLAIDSQKLQTWIKNKDAPLPTPDPPYGQYPIDRPLNPDNPVPWPPGYVPADTSITSSKGEK